MRKLFLSFLAIAACASPARADDPPPFVPVFETDFPDPFILRNGAEFLAYATNSDGTNVQMARSTNLIDWERVSDRERRHDAMPTLPPWAREGFTWAPEVVRTDAGYVLHFTAKDRRSGLQCLGSAFSTDPRGPFTSTATEPLVCQTEIGGTIDSHAFRDADGQFYLYYKNDGNNPQFRRPTTIYAQRLTPDGLNVLGEPAALIRNDARWEAHAIEAPTMVLNGDSYFLFYSANHFGWEEGQRLSAYAMGYARCEGPMGPCAKAPNNPILYSYNNREAGCLSGPGHQSVFDVGGRQFISFHAHGATSGCRRAQLGRYMYIAPLLWRDGAPQLGVSLRPAAPRH